jgi:quercetin dioxygenase-like cupin family protein
MMAERVFQSMDTIACETASDGEGRELPACEHLPAALEFTKQLDSDLREVAVALEKLAPSIRWRRKAGTEELGPAFANGHANAYLVGPDGLVRHDHVVIGLSLLAPQIRYPDHQHPPEEFYLVLSEGDWFNEERDWYTPGPGGMVHHRPNIVHAMRSDARPLLAVWCLWTD